MTNILWIDTATESGSVGLIHEGKTLIRWEHHQEKSHARLITSVIQSLMREAGMSISDLDAVAVNGGPGSYTGLRVGVSTAKGIAMALNLPLMALGSLETIALSFLPVAEILEAWVCPMIDARRMEVYCAFFDSLGQKQVQDNATIIQEDTFHEMLDLRKVIFCGNGASKCKSILSAHKNALFLPEKTFSPNLLAQKLTTKYKNKEFENLADYEPYYLKSYVATVSTKNKLM